MKEQVQLPWSDKGSNDEKSKESKPKAISRPLIADGLAKPKINGVPAYMRCSACNYANCDSPYLANGIDGEWNYFDSDNNRLPDFNGPKTGPRFLPGS